MPGPTRTVTRGYRPGQRRRRPTPVRSVIGSREVGPTTGHRSPFALRSPLLNPSLGEQYAASTEPLSRESTHRRASVQAAQVPTADYLESLHKAEGAPSTLEALGIAATLGLPGYGLAARGSLTGLRAALSAARQRGKTKRIPTSLDVGSRIRLPGLRGPEIATTVRQRHGLSARHAGAVLRHPAIGRGIGTASRAKTYLLKRRNEETDQQLGEWRRRFEGEYGHYPPKPWDVFTGNFGRPPGQ